MTNRPRRNSHRDANQAEIVDGLRTLGYRVLNVSAFVGEFDLLVYGLDWQTQELTWKAFEVKTPNGVLTGKELSFQQDNPGAVQTVCSLEDALSAFNRWWF